MGITKASLHDQVISFVWGGVCMLRGADLGTHLQGWIRDIK